MSAQQRLLSLAAIVAVLFGSIAFGASNAVAAAAPVSVATGLSGTFFIAVGDDGALYGFDAGASNTETIKPPAGAPADATPLQRGLTGSVFRIAPNGTKTTIASGLPAYGGSGASGIVVANGFVWLIISPSPAAQYGAKPYPNEGFLVKIALQGGAVTPVADLAGYENKNNPDGTDVNPNPYGLVLSPDGNLYATDAGGNDLLKIAPATGQIALATLFPTLPGTEANPELGGKKEAQAVPTGIVNAPGGGFFVTNLPGEGGAPAPGSGKIVRVSADGKVSDFATGFNFAVNLAVGPDKQLYIAELVGGFGPQGPTPGKVSRVLADGTKQVIADGLDTPHGLAFNAAGDLFISTGVASLGPPPPAPKGAIVRIDGVGKVAAPSPTPTATVVPTRAVTPVPTATLPANTPTATPPTMPGLPNTGAGGGTAVAAGEPSLPLLSFLALAALAAVGGGFALRRRAR